LAASIYVAARQSGVLRTLDEISESSNVKLKQAARSYRHIVTELDIKAPMINPSKYIVKIANKLGFHEKINAKHLSSWDRLRKRIFNGQGPNKYGRFYTIN
jgi:transcription initiation factor TFIIB